MPKVNIPKQQPNEGEQAKLLSEVLWNSGSPATPFCRNALSKAGFDPDSISPTLLLRAEAINDERWRATFRGMNNDPDSPLKAVVVGDSEFDPAINPNHPIKGAASAKKEEQEKLQLIPNEGNKSAIETKESEQKPVPKRKYQPTPSTTTVGHTPPPKGERKKPGRYELLGHPLTAVIRWMGKEGWTLEQALAVTKHFGIDCSWYTVRGSLWFGARGQQGPPAELTAKQVLELRGIAGIK